jgi:hypothetical protein
MAGMAARTQEERLRTEFAQLDPQNRGFIEAAAMMAWAGREYPDLDEPGRSLLVDSLLRRMGARDGKVEYASFAAAYKDTGQPGGTPPPAVAVGRTDGNDPAAAQSCIAPSWRCRPQARNRFQRRSSLTSIPPEIEDLHSRLAEKDAQLESLKRAQRAQVQYPASGQTLGKGVITSDKIEKYLLRAGATLR